MDVDLSGSIDFDEFKMLMVSQMGDRQSRLKLAFSVFDEDGSGQITKNEMQGVMSLFGLTEQELDEIVKEEMAPPPAQSQGDPKEYLKKWNRVNRF